MSKVKNGLFWNSIIGISRYVLQFLATLVLARILTPEDYGLWGIIAIFVAISESIVDSGLGGALVRKKEVRSVDYSTLTTFNFISAIFIYLVLYFMAPVVVEIYDKPELLNLIRVYSLVIILYSVGLVPTVVLIRKLNFKTIAYINLISSILGIGFAVVSAIYKLGVWSLVIQYLASSLTSSLLFIIMSRYRIRFGFSKSSFIEIFPFGMNTSIGNILNSFTNNIFSNVIAKISTLSLTGYYVQSSRLLNVPVSLYTYIIDSTLFPILSKESDKSILVYKINEINKLLVLVSILTVTVLFLLSKEIVFILLGPTWMNMIPIFNIILISSFFMLTAQLFRVSLKVINKTELIRTSEIKVTFIVLLFIALSMFFKSYILILICYILKSFFRYCFFIDSIRSFLDIRIKEELKFYLKHVLMVLPPLLISLLAGSCFEFSPVLMLCLKSIIFVFILLFIVLTVGSQQYKKFFLLLKRSRK